MKKLTTINIRQNCWLLPIDERSFREIQKDQIT